MSYKNNLPIVTLIIIAGVLTDCGAGNIINPQSTQYVIESTSNSPYPGTLEAYQLDSNYDTTTLMNAVADKICLPGTPEATCLNNQTNLASDFNFKLNQITDGSNVWAYAIQYNTPGVKNENRSVTGGVLIPQVATDQIKGIVIYFHETEVAKNNVPSCFKQSSALPKYCLNNNGIDDGEVLGGVLASQGYIVIMPDYIGQGFDNVVMHPYVLNAQVNAVSGLNMLTATEALLNKLGFQTKPKNLYITGFSEGGAYALWASNVAQNISTNFLSANGLSLKYTAGLSGAYDLANAQLPMEADNLTLDDKYNIGDVFTAANAKPTLVGYLLSGYGFYDLNQTYTSLMKPAFLKCTTCLISGNVYTVPDLFTTYGNPDLNDINIKLYLTTAAELTGYSINGNNSAKALIEPGLLENQAFLTSLSSNSITGWTSAAPVGFVYLNKDSVVTNLNSTNAYTMSSITAKSAIVIDTTRYQYQDQLNSTVKPIDHQQSNVIQLIAALQQFTLYP